jgi:ABC-type cobalamin/Fe3+-siderophores transport system ATPase subunit
MSEPSTASTSNPFATRNTRPGVLEFRFPEGGHAEKLIEKLAGNHWWGEIVGPHGAGKTTLLKTLEPRLKNRGRDVLWYSLRRGQRRLPIRVRQQRDWHPCVQVIIDGYEQLYPWQRWGLRRRCKQRGCGLLVTSHESSGLPLLFQVSASVEMTRLLVQQLLGDEHAGAVSLEEMDRCFFMHQGNVRETFFALYDLFRSRHGAERW